MREIEQKNYFKKNNALNSHFCEIHKYLVISNLFASIWIQDCSLTIQLSIFIIPLLHLTISILLNSCTLVYSCTISILLYSCTLVYSCTISVLLYSCTLVYRCTIIILLNSCTLVYRCSISTLRYCCTRVNRWTISILRNSCF